MRSGLAVLALFSVPLTAQGFTQTGYVRGIAAAYDLGYDLPGVTRRAAFFGAVLRHEIAFAFSPSIRFEAHERVQGTWWPDGVQQQLVGLGVSAVPQRADLSHTLLRGANGSVVSDVDRAMVTFRSRVGDLTVGRQAVTWGMTSVFPVADLWTQFSPFELDTEQKPGTDAVRFLAYPASGVELDLVAADRGPATNFSFGARATVTLAHADVYVAGGKFWREALVMGGVGAVTGVWKLRAEAALPHDLDASRTGRARVTLGVDRIGARWQVTVEYHHNGLGTDDAAAYASVLTSPALSRGETYYLGRHLAGAFGNWQPAERWTLSLGTLVNAGDPSAAVLPAVSWDAGQAYRVIAGGVWSVGGRPLFQAPGGVVLQSEFGTYGRYGYLQGAFYY